LTSSLRTRYRHSGASLQRFLAAEFVLIALLIVAPALALRLPSVLY
jgi:hypothetical protein